MRKVRQGEEYEMTDGHRQALDYWWTLYRTLRGRPPLKETLDMPLGAAVIRARWAVVWTVLCWAAATVNEIMRKAAKLGPLPHRTWPVWVGLYVLCVACAAVLGYGLFRLYTLVTHVLTVNVFKARGQRLRLLNVETTVLSLSAPCALGWGLRSLSPGVGDIIVGLSILGATALLARGYNLVFHTTGWKGLLLLVGGTLITWFVLSIGLLAVLVALAVVSFLAVVVLRLFQG
jgi:hypothetical protein